jgi:FeS assembly SUF system regulator
MINMSKLTDYAAAIMVFMARDSERHHHSASFIAKALGLPIPTASKILKMLATAGLVASVRGADGGYYLQRAPAEISLADVLKAMEGGVALTNCCEASYHCTFDILCTMRDNWRFINNTIQTLLARYSIADMLKPLATPVITQGMTEGYQKHDE